MHTRPTIRLARTAVAVLIAAFMLAGCNGTFTFAKTFTGNSYNVDSAADFEGSFDYTINFRDKIGDDVDKLAEFRILELKLVIDLTNDNQDGSDDDWTFLDGEYTFSITNPDVNGGSATQIASFTGPGPASQTLVIDCTGEDLSAYAKANSDSTVTLTVVSGSSDPTDGSVDVTSYIKVRVTID